MTNTSKVYSTRSNATKAARAALGKDAKKDVDFTIDAAEHGVFTWSRIVKEPVKKARAPRKTDGSKPPVSNQPQVQLLIKTCMRKGGATIAELQEVLGAARGMPVQSHTVRGAMSRSRQDGVVYTPIGEGRCKHFHVEAAPKKD